jgi:hypothetical protein
MKGTTMNDKLSTATEAPTEAATVRPVQSPAEPVHPAIERLRETLAAVELDVLTSYTLADAIREGSSVTDQKRLGWVDQSSACALGAGFLAAKARGYTS